MHKLTATETSSCLGFTEVGAAVQETLYLLSVPGMRESIQAGIAEPIEACATALSW